MSAASFNLALGRVLVAAARADGELDDEERRALEDLLFRLPNWDVEDWRAIEAELEGRQPTPDLRAASRALQREVLDLGDQEVVRSVIGSLQQRLPEDSAEVGALGEALRLALGEPSQEPEPGLFDRLRSALTHPLQRRVAALRSSDQRQRSLEASFAERVRRQWPEDVPTPEEDELHHLCVGAAILGHVAHIDDTVEEGEVEAMQSALVQHWGIEAPEARVVTEIALEEADQGIDLYASMRDFFHQSDEDERRRFLAAVFQVAAGDGRATIEEIEEIRTIGRGMLLSHQHFIAAKLSLGRDQREL